MKRLLSLIFGYIDITDSIPEENKTWIHISKLVKPYTVHGTIDSLEYYPKTGRLRGRTSVKAILKDKGKDIVFSYKTIHIDVEYKNIFNSIDTYAELASDLIISRINGNCWKWIWWRYDEYWENNEKKRFNEIYKKWRSKS